LKSIKYLTQFFNVNLSISYLIVILSVLLYHLSLYLLPLFQKNFIDNVLSSKIIFNYELYLYCSAILLFLITFFAKPVVYSLFELRFKKKIYMHFVKNILMLPKSRIGNGSGSYLDTILTDTSGSCMLLNHTSFDFIFSCIKTIAVASLLFYWSKLLSIIFIVTFIFSIIVSRLASKKVAKNQTKVRESSAFLSQKTLDMINNNFSINMLSRLYSTLNKLSNPYELNRKNNVSYIGSFWISVSCSVVIGYISELIVLIISIKYVLNGNFSFGQMIAVIGYFGTLGGPMYDFSNFMNDIATGQVSLKRLREIEDEVLSYDNMSHQCICIDDFQKLELKNVSFNFNNNEKVYNLNMSLLSNETLGVVGISGEGKSTFIKLLCKSITPDSGKIEFNEINIDNFTRMHYLNKINYFSQEIEIFNEDLEFNLTLGKAIVNFEEYKIAKQMITKSLNKFFAQYKSIAVSSSTAQRKANMIIMLIEEYNFKDFFMAVGLPSNHENINFSNTCDFMKKSHILYSNKPEFFIDQILGQNYIEEELYNKVINVLNISSLKGRDLGEKGSNISGGEAQRIAFGRFLLKKKYDIFILDEPFTNLDPISEKQIVTAAKVFLNNKSGIIISHNFKIILALTNKIILLENGKNSQKMKHEDLLFESNLYRDLYKHSLDINTN
jgi:ABC-type multidrug transport system fused ATPase/permease subunit